MRSQRTVNEHAIRGAGKRLGEQECAFGFEEILLRTGSLELPEADITLAVPRAGENCQRA